MKNFILVFSLFAIFLTINAVPFQLSKRTTTFTSCRGSNEPINVEVHPDPLVGGNPAEFNISGTLNHNFTAGTTFVLIGFLNTNETVPSYISQTFDKSFAANKPFSIIFKFDSIPELACSYGIGVSIREDGHTEDGCAEASNVGSC